MITLDMMPPLMFGGLIVAMLIGFPVAFTLAALGLSFGFLAIHEGFFGLNFLQAIPERVYGNVLANELLLAIPFFTFMAAGTGRRSRRGADPVRRHAVRQHANLVPASAVRLRLV